MGKGDLRSRRGKIFRGTHGNARSRKREKARKRKRGKEGQGTPKLAVVDLKASERLSRPVPLAEIKRERAFADLGLVRMGRLSVMPASAEQYQRLLKLGGMK